MKTKIEMRRIKKLSMFATVDCFLGGRTCFYLFHVDRKWTFIVLRLEKKTYVTHGCTQYRRKPRCGGRQNGF